MAAGPLQRAGIMAMSLTAPRRLTRLMMRPPVQPMKGSLATTGQVERVEMEGEGGALLRGWWIQPTGVARHGQAVILAHGWTSHALRMSGLLEPVLAMGYPVLLYNARGHGDSDPTDYISLAQFTRDLKAAIRFARERADRISVIGHSLGASATLVAAADGEPIEAAVALAPPADPSLISIDILNQMGLPGERLMRRIAPYVDECMRRPLAEIAPERRIGSLTCPVLLVHGTGDEVVPVEHFHKLKRVAPANVETLLVEGVSHDGVKTAPATLARLQEFLPRAFPVR